MRARDGLEAVHKAEELNPDLILLDVDLPKLNGIEVSRKVREVCPRSRILFVSAGTFPELARAALDTGASGYVVKFDITVELLAAIEAVLLGKRYVSRRLAALVAGEDSST
jgi:DNA-binding NarL/FixJ family response regulator